MSFSMTHLVILRKFTIAKLTVPSSIPMRNICNQSCVLLYLIWQNLVYEFDWVPVIVRFFFNNYVPKYVNKFHVQNVAPFLTGTEN
jgi:hypothetical protein